MDIWGWTYAVNDELRDNGYEELADYMDRIPGDTVDGRHEKIDQYAEEAIAMARDAGQPWVEIFLRHWRLQSTVLNRMMPKDMIKEAVSLLEFAHREDNIDCPQSVCVVQDLSNCYAAFDGPGYVEERINVCKECMDRINASWPCYSCIGGEYASALLDAGRYNDCIAFLDECDRALVEAGEGKDTGELIQFRIIALASLGKCDQAREYAKIAKNPYGGENFKNSLKVDKAYIEMCDGKHKNAMKKLPAYEQIRLLASEHLNWSEVIYQAALHDKQFLTEENIQQLQLIAEDMEQRGTYREALELNGWLVELYRLAGDYEKASKALEAMKRVQPNLNRDLGASELINKLSAW